MFMSILAQATQPTINLATVYKVLGGAIIGAATAVGVDLHAFGQAAPGSVFSWKLCLSHAIGGAIAGAIGALGLNVASVQ